MVRHWLVLQTSPKHKDSQWHEASVVLGSGRREKSKVAHHTSRRVLHCYGEKDSHYLAGPHLKGSTAVPRAGFEGKHADHAVLRTPGTCRSR